MVENNIQQEFFMKLWIESESRFNAAYYQGQFYDFQSAQEMECFMRKYPEATHYSCNCVDVMNRWKRQQQGIPEPKLSLAEIRQKYPEIRVRQRKLKKTSKNCGNCVHYHPPEDIDVKYGTCRDRIVYDRSDARHCIGYQSKHEKHLFKKRAREVGALLGADKKYLHMEGDPHNPTVHFHCKRCNEDHVLTWQNLKRGMGHDCAGVLSTGETLVKEWLEKHNIAFCTQYDTLKCINPDTGHQLPYDFQVTNHKLIIEVQGLQHDIFIPWFHVDEEGFEYQKHKDVYKRQFAEKSGYTVLEIHQKDIDSGKYKDMLSKILIH